MNASFTEKSTWISLLAVSAAAAWYFSVTVPLLLEPGLPEQAGLIASTAVGTIAVVGLVLIQIVLHAIAAATSREHDADERDRLIALRGDQVGGLVLGFAVFATVAHILGNAFVEDPQARGLGTSFGTLNLLVAGLVASEIARCTTNLVLYRRGA